MKRHGNFFDRIASFDNLLLASRKAFRSKKDRATVANFYFNLENELISLRNELLSEAYEPKPYRIFEIYEPKPRKICASNFRDRVVHHAVCNVLEPIFEKRFIYDTYACRIGKGTHLAVERCQYFTKRYGYFLKCDVKKYFESIDHMVLKSLLTRMIKDKKTLSLIFQIIDHKVPGNSAGKGIPIGNLTSQLFANFYLGELDHFLKDRLAVKGYLRYMDDFICFAGDKDSLHNLLIEIRQFLDSRLKLQLKEKVITIAPVTEGVPFLGLRVYKNLKRFQRPNLVRIRRKIKKRESQYKFGEISEADFLCSLHSLIGHIKKADTLTLRRKEFERSLFMA